MLKYNKIYTPKNMRKLLKNEENNQFFQICVQYVYMTVSK